VVIDGAGGQALNGFIRLLAIGASLAHRIARCSRYDEESRCVVVCACVRLCHVCALCLCVMFVWLCGAMCACVPLVCMRV
jgi:hypothetical protein